MLCDERNIHVTNGQHYAILDGETVWGEEGAKHPLRYPPGRGEGFIQVHHFKWDSTVLERLKEVSETEEDYTFWEEYKKMYEMQSKIMIGKLILVIQLLDWYKTFQFNLNIGIINIGID